MVQNGVTADVMPAIHMHNDADTKRIIGDSFVQKFPHAIDLTKPTTVITAKDLAEILNIPESSPL